jgi:hypothetical protein
MSPAVAVGPERRVAVAVLAVAGAVVAGSAGARPSGSPAADMVLLAAAGALSTASAAWAPWWLVVVACGAVAPLAPSTTVFAIGCGGVVMAVLGGLRPDRLPEPQAAAFVTTLVVLRDARLGWFYGDTALVAVVAVGTLTVAGLAVLSDRTRRLAAAAGVVVVGASLVVLGATAAAGLRSRAVLRDAAGDVRAGINALEDGDVAAARVRFVSARSAFHLVADRLDGPLVRPARALPLAGKYTAAADGVLERAASLTDAALALLDELDTARLGLGVSQIDLPQLRVVAREIRDVRAEMDQLVDELDALDAPWMATAVSRRSGTAAEELRDGIDRLGQVLAGVDAAPAWLGADGPRRYVVMFTTPAEARGLGGFMGNFAEITVESGRIRMTRFGRTVDLNVGGDPASRRISGLEDFLGVYGRFGFREPETGITAPDVWSNVTMSPDFPTVATLVDELYPQSGGQAVDGVVLMDVYTLADLLRFTGPVIVEGVAEPVTAETAADFLLRRQYELFDPADQTGRVDALETMARTMVERLLGGSTTDVSRMVAVLAPRVEQRRLMLWLDDPAEEQVLDRLGVAGALPAIRDDDGAIASDGIGLVVNNAVANKIDVFLRRSLQYRATVDPATGAVDARATVTLANDAPAQGLPPYVIGNTIGAPPGTNRMYLSLYTPLDLVWVTEDGALATLGRAEERGWNVYSTYVTLEPGSSVTLEVALRGTVARPDGSTAVHVLSQPLVQPLEADVRVADTADRLLVAYAGPLDRHLSLVPGRG